MDVVGDIVGSEAGGIASRLGTTSISRADMLLLDILPHNIVAPATDSMGQTHLVLSEAMQSWVSGKVFFEVETSAEDVGLHLGIAVVSIWVASRCVVVAEAATWKRPRNLITRHASSRSVETFKKFSGGKSWAKTTDRVEKCWSKGKSYEEEIR